MNERAQTVLDGYAEGVPYDELAATFREHRRWTGDDPRLWLAEAAASTTGQRFLGGIKPAVERFREVFVDAGRVDTLGDLAALEATDADLIDAFGAQRKRRVLLEAARALDARPADGDLTALVAWAASADHYRYDEDPVGSIAGVGPSSFQLLRQLAGVETIRPDPNVAAFVTAVGADLETAPLEATTGLRTIAAVEWLAAVTSYTPLEIDRLAWWHGTDPEEREAIAAVHESAVERRD